MESDTNYIDLIFKFLKFIVPFIILAMTPKLLMITYDKKDDEKTLFDIPPEIMKKITFGLYIIICVGLVIFGTISVLGMPKNNAEMFKNIFGGLFDGIKIGDGPIGQLIKQFGNTQF